MVLTSILDAVSLPLCRQDASTGLINPDHFAYYESALALCSYFKSDYRQAVMWIRKTTVPTNANYHAIAAAIFGEEDSNEAERERAWLDENASGMVKNVMQELALRFGERKTSNSSSVR